MKPSEGFDSSLDHQDPLVEKHQENIVMTELTANHESSSHVSPSEIGIFLLISILNLSIL